MVSRVSADLVLLVFSVRQRSTIVYPIHAMVRELGGVSIWTVLLNVSAMMAKAADCMNLIATTVPHLQNNCIFSDSIICFKCSCVPG